ncbi:MAG: HAD hydrolase family protein [Candidatus Omnitrophica bacterium]|nr:HAD hydrolase family protein [Candidatus Omnitrophota bacterium]
MQERLKKIKALMLDVDGVLTDGGMIIDSNGVETKRFDVQDGFGLVFWKKCGFKSAIISARQSKVVAHRANDLQIDKVLVGVYPKIDAYKALLKEWRMKDEEVCFVGDDVVDLGILRRVGFAAAVANAVLEVKSIAHYVSTKKGGEGAVREIIELILKAQKKWSPQLYEH